MKNVWWILACLPWTVCMAQDLSFRKNQVSLGAAVEVSHLLSGDEYAREFLQSHGVRYYNFHLRFRSLSDDAYDKAFRYPSIELGLLAADFSDIRLFRKETPSQVSGMGTMWALYGAFHRDLLSAGPFHLNYFFENGVAWSTKPYDGYHNPDNEFIGAPFSVYFGMGVGGGFQLNSHWKLDVGIHFRHFSNSALDRPNKGSNTVGASIGVSRSLSSPDTYPSTGSSPFSFQRHFYLDILAGWLGRTLMEDWFYSIQCPSDDPRHRTKDFRLYSAFGTSVSAMYRYSLRFASGLGLDYAYLPYVSEIERYDQQNKKKEERYSRHSLGVAMKHEVFYKRLSLYFSLGYYLHRHTGSLSHEFEKPYYETLGLRYTFPFFEKMYVGYHVKAHLLRADCMEVNVGMRLP